jgi:NitT/TauT family transport system ATP-binding protein
VDEAVYLANRVVVMAPHPGRVETVVDVDLPYPRSFDMRTRPEFNRLRRRVWDAVHGNDLRSDASGNERPPGRNGVTR